MSDGDSDGADEFGDFNEFSAFQSETTTAQAQPVECEESGTSWNAFAEDEHDADGEPTQDDSAPSGAWASFSAENNTPANDPIEGGTIWTHRHDAEEEACVAGTLVNDYVVDDLMNDTFDTHSCDEEFDCTCLLDDLKSEQPKCHNSCAKVCWSRVHILEESPALGYQWGDKTQVFQSFLNALSIDYNLAKMRNSSLPAFAQHLGTTLTPLKNGDSPKINPGQSQIDSLSVPPVQFDWSNSGLTNPLTGASNSSAILDLDYLSSNDFKSQSKTCTLQKDLESLGLTDDCSPRLNGYSKKCDRLEEVLKDTSKLTWNGPISASEALPETFPDLSYMLSPVLMFPVKTDKLK